MLKKMSLGFTLTAIALMTAPTASMAGDIGESTFADAISITAVLVDQQCQGGDNVRVTLSATGQSDNRPVKFRWDFNNDGRFDTGVMNGPKVVTLYTDEVTRTARIAARDAAGDIAEDTVTFQTLRCE